MPTRGRKSEHFDPLGATEGEPLPEVGYDPAPPLDIDLSPIDGDALRAWRKRQYTEEGRTPYPSIKACVRDWPISMATWSGWENGTPIPRGWRPLLREWMISGRTLTIPREAPDAKRIKALAVLLDGYERTADALGVEPKTVRDWASGSTPGVRGGYGPLLAWLVDDMALEPTDRDMRNLFRDDEIRRMRALADDHTNTKIADKFDVPRTTVDRILRGEGYDWVD